MIKLFHFKLCPFSRRARVSLSELGVEHLLIDEKVWDRRREFLSINPAGTLPVIIDDDEDITIINIYAITEFLEEKFYNNHLQDSLIPGEFHERAETRRLIDWFDLKFHREVSGVILRELIDKYYIKDQASNASPNMDSVRIAQENLIYHFNYLSHLVSSRKWIAGDKFTQADIAAASHISCLDYLNKINWDNWEEIRNWYARIKSRASFSDILSDKLPGFQPPIHYSNPDF
jgi:glutathione S-transferase